MHLAWSKYFGRSGGQDVAASGRILPPETIALGECDVTASLSADVIDCSFANWSM